MHCLLNRLMLVAALSAVSSTAWAQRGDSSGRAVQQTADPSTAGRQGAGGRDTSPVVRHRLSQYVMYQSGHPVVAALVSLQLRAPGDTTVKRTVRTDTSGLYVVDSLAAGSYAATIEASDHHRVTAELVVDGRQQAPVIVPQVTRADPWWTLLTLVVFLATILLSRWNHIARSLQQLVLSQFAALETRLKVESDPARRDRLPELAATIKELREQFRRSLDESSLRVFLRPWDMLYWSRGVENAAWSRVHELERLLVNVATTQQVKAQLVWAEADLRAVDGTPAVRMAEAITASLASGAGAGDAAKDEEWRALLDNALGIIYESRDMTFAAFMEWQNKAAWLMLAAIIIIYLLAVSVGNAVLLLAGAAGGFLSRVARAINRDDIPLDYGASWTTLFLSPLFGAMIGWFGIALIAFATQPQSNLLGTAFGAVDWYTPTAPITLAIAFALGFSERLFNAVVGAVEAHAVKLGGDDPRPRRPEGAPPARQPAPAGPPPSTGENPPSSAGGVTIDISDDPITPVQLVKGTITLSSAAAEETDVALSSNNTDYEVKPAALRIGKGKTSATFDVVPKGTPVAATVVITAKVGNTTVSDVVRYT